MTCWWVAPGEYTFFFFTPAPCGEFPQISCRNSSYMSLVWINYIHCQCTVASRMETNTKSNINVIQTAMVLQLRNWFLSSLLAHTNHINYAGKISPGNIALWRTTVRSIMGCQLTGGARLDWHKEMYIGFMYNVDHWEGITLICELAH